MIDLDEGKYFYLSRLEYGEIEVFSMNNKKVKFPLYSDAWQTWLDQMVYWKQKWDICIYLGEKNKRGAS